MKALDKIILSVKRRSFYLKSQFWTREQITEYHEKKLIEIVRRSGKNVPSKTIIQKIDLNPRTLRTRGHFKNSTSLNKDIYKKITIQRFLLLIMQADIR